MEGRQTEAHKRTFEKEEEPYQVALILAGSGVPLPEERY